MQHIPNKTRADTVTGHLGMYKASCGERQCTSDIEMSLQAIKSNLLSKFPFSKCCSVFQDMSCSQYSQFLIIGYPLMNFDGDVQSLNRQQYRAWHKENPAITNYLTAEV